MKTTKEHYSVRNLITTMDVNDYWHGYLAGCAENERKMKVVVFMASFLFAFSIPLNLVFYCPENGFFLAEHLFTVLVTVVLCAILVGTRKNKVFRRISVECPPYEHLTIAKHASQSEDLRSDEKPPIATVVGVPEEASSTTIPVANPDSIVTQDVQDAL